jgi:V8-like Glu-specific endopeptidase
VKKALKTMALSVLFLGLTVAARPVLPRMTIPAIAKYARGAVVSIIMSGKDGSPIAQGSGFLISKDGLILTNYHVIESGISAVVKLPDGAFFAVDGVVAFDKARDVAIIKAHGENFRTLTLGNSDQLQVGEEVVAIGNPLSLESTVSNGIISGIRAAEEEGGKFLQVTTPISPGSSGGPLFKMAGEVVGITTLYLKGGENLNFAIPINDAKRLLLSNSSKVQALPNETEPVKAPPAQQGTQQNVTKPLSESEIDSLRESGEPVERVLMLVKERGIDFVPDSDFLSNMRLTMGYTSADNELITLLQNASKAQTVDCAQYEQTKGCLVFNEMIRAHDNGLLGLLEIADETFVMFDPHGEGSVGYFDLVYYNVYGNKVVIGRPGFINGQTMRGAVDVVTLTVGCPNSPGIYKDVWCRGFDVQYKDETVEGFREVIITSTEVRITVGFSTMGRNVEYSEVFQRSTGRYRHTHHIPVSPVGTTFGKAAVYHHLVLQQ